MNTAPATSPPTEWRPHPGGAEGAKVSLEKCSDRIRQDYLDPLVVAFARRVLQDSPQATTTRGKAQALLSAMKARARYILDPVNSEYIASARLILCLDSTQKDYCHAGGDCDELTCTMCSMLMAVGIDCKLVGQSFTNSGVPSHVLLAAFDPQSETWFKIDPSTSLPVGQAYPASSEVEVDPLTGKVPDFSGPSPTATFVGVGMVPVRAASGALGYVPAHALGQAQAQSRAAGVGLFTAVDVFTYRAMWDQYVLDTIRAALDCSQAYAAVANNNKSDAQLYSILMGISQTTAASANSMLKAWNAYAGIAQTKPEIILLDSANILQYFQSVVVSAGNLRDSLTHGTLTCDLTYPGPNGPVTAVSVPDTSLQTKVIATLEGLGAVGKGILNIFTESATQALVFAGNTAQKVVNAATSPWLWVSLAVGAASLAVIVYAVETAPARAAAVAARSPAPARLAPARARARR